MVWETGVQSLVKSYQRLKKWYLIPPCLTLSIIRYVSRVKRSNQGKEVAPSPIPQCSSYWKGSLQVTLDYSHQLYLLFYYYSTPLFIVSFLLEEVVLGPYISGCIINCTHGALALSAGSGLNVWVQDGSKKKEKGENKKLWINVV